MITHPLGLLQTLALFLLPSGRCSPWKYAVVRGLKTMETELIATANNILNGRVRSLELSTKMIWIRMNKELVVGMKKNQVL